MGSEVIPYQEVEKMAQMAFKAGIFGFKTIEQAISLMLVCQAEGLHPMKATQLFDILPTGKVGMKSTAMLANFQARGGKVKWVVVSDTECEAVFTSVGLSEPVTVRWTMKDAALAGLNTKQNWRAYPRQMLAARVTTDGVNRADPAARLGFYPTEVVQDIEDEERGKRGMKALLTAGYGEPGKAQGETSPQEPEPEPTEEELESPAILSSTPLPDAPQDSREAIREAFGVERLNDEAGPGKAPRAPRRRTEEPMGPHPEACPKCGSELGEYVSAQKNEANRGRKYLQCRAAHDQRGQLVELFNASDEEAQKAVSHHYRAWKEARIEA